MIPLAQLPKGPGKRFDNHIVAVADKHATDPDRANSVPDTAAGMIVQGDGAHQCCTSPLEFHPYLVQQDLIDYCSEQKIQFASWSPLMQGRAFDGPELRSLARKYKKDVAQLISRWNLQKGVVVIPKSVRKERIISNAQIFDFAISAEDMQAIDRLDRHERVGADPDTFDF